MSSPKRARVEAPSSAQAKKFVPSMGAPRYRPSSGSFTTAGGVLVSRQLRLLSPAEFAQESGALVSALDTQRGCIFESSYEYPGRYARWTMGFVNPPLVLEGRGRDFTVKALNQRGMVLLPAIMDALRCDDAVQTLELSPAPAAGTSTPSSSAAPFTDGRAERADSALQRISGTVKSLPAGTRFPEEQRSRQPSIFSVVRALTSLFGLEPSVDPQLGLYGSFGYDLTFQFEAVRERHGASRAAAAGGAAGGGGSSSPTTKQRDLLLYLPDSIIVLDGPAKDAYRMDYDFEWNGLSTRSLPRNVGVSAPFKGVTDLSVRRDHAPGEYAKKVAKAKEQFRVGNLFEVVLSQVFYEPCAAPPSEILARLRERNPSPYMFVINLGESEHLVGASPEMFVRCETTPQHGIRVETCPISGTIRRGADALEDAERIKEILTNKKEESELTMCTDVDRNDKSRICKPGSVRVIGRRQIEKYSKLIHTVDHVEGYLRDGYDALDAFLCHTWAVTVTGAPKPWAIQFVEDNEETERKWYAGAVGLVGFDGHLNTGLTLRTIHIQEGVASVRAGATLLFDSDPAAEETETELKASAFRDAILRPRDGPDSNSTAQKAGDQSALGGVGPLARDGVAGLGKRILLVDHQDSFVHTLANYLRQTGAAVTTCRFGLTCAQIEAQRPDLVVLSPGPGRPSDFKLSDTISSCVSLGLPVFGVCLGLQGIVEHFGGKLGVLSYPMHGKPSEVRLCGGGSEEGRVKDAGGCLFRELPETFTVARYHSLYAIEMPTVLSVTARVEEQGDGSGAVVMAVEHKSLPIAAVQFHPESILTSPAIGLKILANAIQLLK